MSSNFLETFLNNPVRERSGSISSSRFDYQKNWSLCTLLELHKNNSDYLMVLDYHDDVVVFNSEINPSSAIFYQVKSKASGNWTIKSLTESKNGTDSILGKLYNHHLGFSSNAKQLIFTSNRPLSAKLKNSESSTKHSMKRVGFSDLSNTDKENIRNSVESNNQTYCDVNGLQKILTERNDLEVADHDTKTKGKLVEFFEKMYPEYDVHIALTYKTFFDEIRRKTNYENYSTEVTDLIKYKSIGKSNLNEMIGIAIKRRSDSELWNEANNILLAEGFVITEIMVLRDGWQEYTVNKMNVSNEFHISMTENIKNQISLIYRAGAMVTFRVLSDKILDCLMRQYSNDYSKAYLQSAVLYEVLRNDSISKTNKKFKKEAK